MLLRLRVVVPFPFQTTRPVGWVEFHRTTTVTTTNIQSQWLQTTVHLHTSTFESQLGPEAMQMPNKISFAPPPASASVPQLYLAAGTLFLLALLSGGLAISYLICPMVSRQGTPPIHRIHILGHVALLIRLEPHLVREKAFSVNTADIIDRIPSRGSHRSHRSHHYATMGITSTSSHSSCQSRHGSSSPTGLDGSTSATRERRPSSQAPNLGPRPDGPRRRRTAHSRRRNATRQLDISASRPPIDLENIRMEARHAQQRGAVPEYSPGRVVHTIIKRASATHTPSG
jgi:hypothetical protein